ncbi:2'-5' RNA ligase family protein [Halapricum salinum]|uniref:2'-5' RNA ligase family protein n=1 Tax=Halapricum salinum TaxID=1457250 RepID=A0A4D6H9K0_9EURY|nr:2'-5' RNA ligase family protein [Halapricum salinum]QCC50345.1 2'-5' RNA ligase family protein [Halapricum salinum]
MYSLNVPLPSSVTRLASRLARDLPRARARPRGEHTLVVKRLGSGDGARLATSVDEHLSDVAPFELRVREVDSFETAATGGSPVSYLRVESQELRRLHERLCSHFEPVDGIEGNDYVPHVTIARGGDLASVRRLADREIDSIRWTAEELVVWDSERNLDVRQFSLPR